MGSGLWQYLMALFIWPGLIVAALLSWFFLWLMRKLTARLQGRQGPPFYQPFYDFIKLLGKRTIVSDGVNRTLFYALPIAATVSVVFALALLPLAGNPLPSFTGDLIILLYLLEMPAFCTILAGYVSGSLYGQVSSAREAVLLLCYNLPFLASVVALAVQSRSFELAALAHQPWTIVHLIAALTFLLAVPARLRSNPFSIGNAEQEIVAGAMTEYNGLPLAFFEFSHGLELVALVGLFDVLFIPKVSGVALSLLVYLVVSLLVVITVTLLAVSTARIRVNQAFRFYWWWGAIAALASFAAAFLLRS